MPGLFVTSFSGAVLCCAVFGIGIGGVAAFMNVIFVESLGIEMIQVRKYMKFHFFTQTFLSGYNRTDVSLHWSMDAAHITCNRSPQVLFV